jgi:predicted nucleic acid-binding Zn ribbon protein
LIVDGRCCDLCAQPLGGQRSDARFCSRACKENAKRRRDRAALRALSELRELLAR